MTAKVISARPADEIEHALRTALGWFDHVERACSRFDPDSEVFRLASQVRQPVQTSPLLFEAIRFAVEVAVVSDGVFDPTIGVAQAKRGFDRNYKTGERVLPPPGEVNVSYRDILLDRRRQTVTLRKPLLVDLGAVAKGIAVDLAAKELADFESFFIDAGGDLYVKGRNERGESWHIGIEHPRRSGFIVTLKIDQGAICTSGDYVRKHPDAKGEHHLLDPRTGSSPREVISCTVVAARAMLADALSTAAYVAGPEAGLRMLEEQRVDGMLVGCDQSVGMTHGFRRWTA